MGFFLKTGYLWHPGPDQNKRAGLEKSATLIAYLLSKLINEQGGIIRLLHEKLRVGWKENLKNLSKHALLLETSE